MVGGTIEEPEPRGQHGPRKGKHENNQGGTGVT
jgi:hypothetical protein